MPFDLGLFIKAVATSIPVLIKILWNKVTKTGVDNE